MHTRNLKLPDSVNKRSRITPAVSVEYIEQVVEWPVEQTESGGAGMMCWVADRSMNW